MENDRFDALTRALSAADSRRRTLHAFGSLLLGGVLGGFAASLSADEDAEAKAKKHGKRHKDHKRSGKVQAAGKKHKKNKHKNKHKDKDKPIPPLPPGCENCGTCQKCEDGACVPDPDLDVIRCLDSPDDPGGQCHICGNGECIPYQNGSVCNDGDECSWCQDGRCVPVPEKDLEPCGDGLCKLCDQGRCTTAGNGSRCDDADGRGVCCDAYCIHPTCGPDEEYDRRSCTCQSACADDEAPDCGPCQEAVCVDGEYLCRSACEGDAICCGGSCVSITCPPGQVFDGATCQCKPAGVCPNGSPDYCSGGDWSRYRCGDPEFNCFCMKSTTGGTHCSSRTSDPYSTCLVDADCEQTYPGRETFCHHCSHTCYFIAECAATSPQ